MPVYPGVYKTGSVPYLTIGSNNLRISEKVSQSLAGRTHLLEVLPFARSDFPQDVRSDDLDTVLFYGGYPRIYKEELNPSQWLADYFATYVEKDVRSIINIENLRSFDTFLRLIGGRVGQLINFSSLSSDAGITHPTARKWLSALEASYICFILQPHYKNLALVAFWGPIFMIIHNELKLLAIRPILEIVSLCCILNKFK